MTASRKQKTHFKRACRVLPVIVALHMVMPLAAQDDAGSADKLPSPKIDISGGEGNDQRSYNCTLSREAILRGPDWTPGTPAPLPPEKAARIAREKLSQIANSGITPSWKVMKISISALYGTDYRKWYYTITFGILEQWKDPASPSAKPVPGWAMEAAVYVAMDGTPGTINGN